MNSKYPWRIGKVSMCARQSLESDLTMRFLERWGMVAADAIEEDSIGRSRLTLLPPEIVVARAVEVAKHVVKALEREGWIEPLPEPTEAEKMVRDIVARTGLRITEP